MNEVIYYQDDCGLRVSNVSFSCWSNTIEIATITDFDVLRRRAFNAIAYSSDSGLEVGTPYLQLQLISPFGRKNSWIPVTFRSYRDLAKLRGLVMGLAKARAATRQVAANSKPSRSRSHNRSKKTLFSTRLWYLRLPHPIGDLVGTLHTILSEPTDNFNDGDSLFRNHIISGLSDPAAFTVPSSTVELKVIYEYQKFFGGREHPFLARLQRPGITVGQIFRPLVDEEVGDILQLAEDLNRDL